MKWNNVKPQFDEIEFGRVNRMIPLSEDRLVSLGSAIGSQSCVISLRLIQFLAPIDLFTNNKAGK